MNPMRMLRCVVLAAVSAGTVAAQSRAELGTTREEMKRSMEELRKLDARWIDVTTVGEAAGEGKAKGRDTKFVWLGEEWDAEKALQELSPDAPVAVIQRKESPDTYEIASSSLGLFKRLGDKIAPGWLKAKLPVALQQRFETLNPDYESYNAAYLAALREPAANRDLLQETARKLSENTAGVMIAAAQDPRGTAQGTLFSLLAMEQIRDLEQKAVYGPRSNYPLESYAAVLANAPAIGRIEVGSRSTATCVLIGRHLVATAAHAVAPYNPSAFWVTFDDGQGGRHRYRQSQVVTFRPKTVVAGVTTGLDLAVFEIKPEFADRDVVARLEPLALGTDPVLLDDGVYVMGHPEVPTGFSPLTVHDACFAIYPHWANTDQVNSLLVRAVRHQLLSELNLVEVLQGFRPLSNETIQKAIAEQQVIFDRLYANGQPDDPGRFYLRPPIANEVNVVPVFGLDADASAGDSGGGVFRKDGGPRLLAGLFVSGAAGTNTIYSASLRRHEHAIPARVIAHYLQANHGGEVIRYGIRITPPLP